MLSKHYGGERVSAGIYWSHRDGEFITVEGQGGRLAGGENYTYTKTPAALVLTVGPLMGIVFAFFLPLSGILVMVPFLAAKMREALMPATMRMATFQAMPGVSYLERTPASGSAQVSVSRSDSKLILLAEEIAARRMRETEATHASSQQ